MFEMCFIIEEMPAQSLEVQKVEAQCNDEFHQLQVSEAIYLPSTRRLAPS